MAPPLFLSNFGPLLVLILFRRWSLFFFVEFFTDFLRATQHVCIIAIVCLLSPVFFVWTFSLFVFLAIHSSVSLCALRKLLFCVLFALRGVDLFAVVVLFAWRKPGVHSCMISISLSFFSCVPQCFRVCFLPALAHWFCVECWQSFVSRQLFGALVWSSGITVE